MLVGVLGGAIAAANSFKVRKTVKDGQEQIIAAIGKMGKNDKADSSSDNDEQENANKN